MEGRGPHVSDRNCDLEAGACFWSSFLSWYVKKIVRQFSFLFSGNARILFKTTAMERFFYSIVYIASCLIGFLMSRSLTLSISKQDESVHSISLLTGGHRSSRILSAAVGEEVQCWRCRRRRWRKPMCTVFSEPALARTKVLALALVRCLMWADPAHPPQRHLAHLRYNFFWISCFIVLVQLPRSLHAGFLLCHYSPAPPVQ